MTALRGAGAIASALALILVGWRTNALRNGTRSEGARAAYEPARCVVAWWAFVALVVYGYLSIVRSSAPDSFDGPVTAVAAIAALATFIVWASEDQPTPTHGFLRDLASDRGDVALHTVQFVAWNAFLGVAIAVTSGRTRQVPSIGWQVVVLMGISAAYYVVFRVSRLGGDSTR